MDINHKIESSFINLEKGKIYKTIISDTEKILIEKALRKTHGNQILAARILGLNRNTIRSKIKKLSIDMESFKE